MTKNYIKLGSTINMAVLISALLILNSCIGNNVKKMKGSRPNIVFILADDMGWADLPAYGNEFNEAPNLTRMAANGIRFTNAYAACPVCSPTRASIMSGQYPARVGITDFITGHWRPFEEVTVPKNRNQHLPHEIYTLGELMKDAAYATAYFGKWHLGGREYYPKSQGFDVSNVYQGGGFFHYADRMEVPIDADSGLVLSETLTNLGLDFIEKNQDNPFFLYLAHYDVHVQLDADSLLIRKYLNKEKAEGYPSNAVYAAMVEHVDNSVGRILERLEKLGLAENTLVVYFSDNGGLISRFDKRPLLAGPRQHIYQGDTLLYIASSNAPLRAEKGTVYEGGIREPLIVQWPGTVPAGQVSDAIISSVDFFPTFSELTGADLPGTQVFDGESFINIMAGGKQEAEREVFWHYPVYHHDFPASVIRKGDWKLIHYLHNDTRLLYNLEDDMGETKDLSHQHPEKTEDLYLLLENWRRDAGAELPVPNPNFDPARRYEWNPHPDSRQYRMQPGPK